MTCLPGACSQPLQSSATLYSRFFLLFKLTQWERQRRGKTTSSSPQLAAPSSMLKTGLCSSRYFLSFGLAWLPIAFLAVGLASVTHTLPDSVTILPANTTRSPTQAFTTMAKKRARPNYNPQLKKNNFSTRPTTKISRRELTKELRQTQRPYGPLHADSQRVGAVEARH